MRKTLTYRNKLHLSYAESGSLEAYPILVQHGLIASIDDWDLFDRLLKKPVRLICSGRPGYGESSPCVLESYVEWANITAFLIRELRLEQFDILAMSSGAPYGYSIGSCFPGQVRRLYVFSGTPALYDEKVLSIWPYPPAGDQSLASLEKLARELFFQNLTKEDLKRNDIRDSLMNNAFGVAQDMRLRFLDWGFRLSDVKAKVFMQHSKGDEAIPYPAAVRTAALLPDCTLELKESGPHFSPAALDEFLERTVLGNIG